MKKKILYLSQLVWVLLFSQVNCVELRAEYPEQSYPQQYQQPYTQTYPQQDPQQYQQQQYYQDQYNRSPQSYTTTNAQYGYDTYQAAQQNYAQQRMVQVIREKLTNKDGKFATVAILKPIDYTGANLEDVIKESVQRSLQKYVPGDLNVTDITMDNLTLESFRSAAIKNDAEVNILFLTKPESFELFLYDRRNAYGVVTHLQPIPDASYHSWNKSVVDYYANHTVLYGLYKWANQQALALPREKETKPFMVLPRRVASVRNLERINRDLSNSFYVAGSVGAAITKGESGSYWNSSVIALQLGVRLYEEFFLEVGVDAFSYWAAVGSLKKVFRFENSPFRVAAGLGASWTTGDKSIEWDQSNGLPGDHTFAVPSAALLFPVGDANLKIETRLFVGLDTSALIYSIMPGIYLSF